MSKNVKDNVIKGNEGSVNISNLSIELDSKYEKNGDFKINDIQIKSNQVKTDKFLKTCVNPEKPFQIEN